MMFDPRAVAAALTCTRPIISYTLDLDRCGLSARIPIGATTSPYPEHVRAVFEVGVYVFESTYRVEVGRVHVSSATTLFTPREGMTIDEFREPIGMALRMVRKRVEDVFGCKSCLSDLRLKIEAAYAVVLDRAGVAWMPECER
jgi:hypothetical protein